jgi:DNA-binding SARP family transcriptional activator
MDQEEHREPIHRSDVADDELERAAEFRSALGLDPDQDVEATLAALATWHARWPTEPPTALSMRIDIGVLGGFSVTIDGRPVTGLPVGSQRLLVFLALHDRTVSRAAIAAAIWPDVSAARAGVSLRSSLARLEGLGREAVVAASSNLSLTDIVTVDYINARALAHRLLDSDTPIFDGDLAAAAIATLSRELLPDWFDEWILTESDDWRHLRATAVEALAVRLLKAGRFAEAEGAARAAMRVDPLRETPHSALIRIHLADGNQSEALSVFEAYRAALRDALDLEPTEQLTGLVAGIQR